MIICHEQEIIFVKTKKVGGTSFEITLSGQCGPRCVITQITPQDEKIRQALGYRGPQNFRQNNDYAGGIGPTAFRNHDSAGAIRRRISQNTWETYKKSR